MFRHADPPSRPGTEEATSRVLAACGKGSDLFSSESFIIICTSYSHFIAIAVARIRADLINGCRLRRAADRHLLSPAWSWRAWRALANHKTGARRALFRSAQIKSIRRLYSFRLTAASVDSRSSLFGRSRFPERRRASVGDLNPAYSRLRNSSAADRSSCGEAVEFACRQQEAANSDIAAPTIRRWNWFKSTCSHRLNGGGLVDPIRASRAQIGCQMRSECCKQRLIC